MSFKDDDKVLDKFWLRANFGGKYSSENFDAQINIRMFALILEIPLKKN